MENINTVIYQKFVGLVNYLAQTNAAFEMVADEIEDFNLKTAFNGLSTDSLNYAYELSGQLRMLGLKPEIPNPLTSNELLTTDYPPSNEKGGEVMELCANSESNITKAYKEILNDYFPFQGLREVMTYQLNALISSYMKIRVMNVNRFSKCAIS